MTRKYALTKGDIVTAEIDDRCMMVGFIGALLCVTRVADCKIQESGMILARLAGHVNYDHACASTKNPLLGHVSVEFGRQALFAVSVPPFSMNQLWEDGERTKRDILRLGKLEGLTDKTPLYFQASI